MSMRMFSLEIIKDSKILYSGVKENILDLLHGLHQRDNFERRFNFFL